MDRSVDDETAARFAAGFYRGLAHGRDYLGAFEVGRAEVALLHLPDATVPRFAARNPRAHDEAAVRRVSRGIPTTEAVLYPLWFGTNRRPVDPHHPARGFSAEREDNGRVHHGRCQVTVPRWHTIGELGSPWWKRLLTGRDDRLRLDWAGLRALAAADFWSDVRGALEAHDPGERTALVFLHGYCNTFEDAALRAAQVGCDLGAPGLTAFFSWPSRGKHRDYTRDEASIEASEGPIAEFLTRFAEDAGAERVHLIAHSMGNRGLLRSLHRIADRVTAGGRVPFGQIFLAAPDVDADLFRQLADVYQRVARRTTLYASSRDRALAASGFVHGFRRAGYVPPVTVLPGIDTVEVTDVDLTFLGHGYYGEVRDVLHDMHALLRHDDPPAKRMGLRPAATPEGQGYWVINR
jgi:esterase/lipase superfamily enzyme